jgi:capsular exopolysaccharide synthesis family protein
MADSPIKPPPPASHASADRDDELVQRRSFRDYYIILRERIWIALPLALLVSIGYGYMQMQVPRMYAASATMQFEKPDTIVTTVGVVDQAVRSDIDLNTYLQILSSGKLRAKVMESFTPEERKILQRAALKNSPPGTPPSSVAPQLGTPNFVSLHNSFLIAVNVTHEDPEAAALVANAYVKQFMNYLIDNAGGRNDSAIEYLNEAAERMRKESDEADMKLQQYMRERNLLSLDGSMNMVSEALKTAYGRLQDARLTLLRVEDQVKQVESFAKSGKNKFELTFIANYGAVPSLKAQLDGLLQTQARLAERYLEKHPLMIDNANNIAITQEHLDKAVELAIAALYTQRDEARQSVKTFEAEYAKREKESFSLNEMSIEYNRLKGEADVKKQQYTQLLNRLNETQTSKNIDKIPLHPLDPATPNPNPISPNKSAITRTCTGLGILIFVGVAVGLSFIDDRIKSAWDVESFVGANLLGIIPDLASMKDDEKYSLLLNDSQTPGAEAFLSVYSSIKIHSKLDFPKSILVTSTIPGEGKTLISCNVAGSFARHGKKTLLIDCDLRRPMLHRHFKQQNNTGLLSWFENGAPIEGDLANSPSLGIIKVGENLSLLCSGGRSKSPTELLESPMFGQLLEKLKREYDLVIVDSPPLGAVTDSLLIAERIDEVVYVCRFNRAYRKHIRLYMRALRNGKNEVLGIVLNGLSPRRIEYYSNYRYYRSYKKYYGAQT